MSQAAFNWLHWREMWRQKKVEGKFELHPSVPNKHTNHKTSGYFGSLELTPKAATSPEHEGFLWIGHLWDLDQEPRSNYLYSFSFTFPFNLPEIGPTSQSSLRTIQESQHTFNMTFFIVLIFLVFHARISVTLHLHDVAWANQVAWLRTRIWTCICHISGQSPNKSVTRYFVVCAADLFCSHIFKSLTFSLQTNEHFWNHGTTYSAIFLGFAQP